MFDNEIQSENFRVNQRSTFIDMFTSDDVVIVFEEHLQREDDMFVTNIY